MTDGYTQEQTDTKAEIVIKIDFDSNIQHSFLDMWDFWIGTAAWDYKVKKYFSTIHRKLNRLNTQNLIFSTGQDTWNYFHGFMSYVNTSE